MGRSPREQPKRLAPKLLHIRLALNLTQEQMAEELKRAKPSIRPGHVSELERGLREPTIPLLLRYARLAGLPMEVLADDELDLPDDLSAKLGYEWVMKPVRVRQSPQIKKNKDAILFCYGPPVLSTPHPQQPDTNLLSLAY